MQKSSLAKFSKRSPAEVIRLMEALTTIDRIARKTAHMKAVKNHATMVLNMAESSFEEPNDIEDLKMRSKLLNLS